ncbi:MAG: NGG1p interacting factor NIF3 [Gammaproteobacteria bacterium]|nr:MAG: NGG1p interacting factor NIF3 [Gammaproteobacteria bacterium]
MYKIAFFVPEEHKEAVKQAVFNVGAGRIGDYDSCSWETLGVGQFRPLPGANPFIGKQGDIEQVQEYRVELVCRDELVKDAILALKQAHPYEEPAYDVWRVDQVVY